MKEKKYYIAFDRYEQGTMINALNEMRNRLIAEGRYTDAVDELIIKICNSPFQAFERKPMSEECRQLLLVSLDTPPLAQYISAE